MEVRDYYYNDFKLADELKERGVKKTGLIHFARRANSNWVDIPVMFANGVEDGPVLLVDAGNHGDEFEGTEGIIKAFQAVDVQKIKGSLVCIPALNMESFGDLRRYGSQEFVPLDMNRIYPGSKEGTLTKALANFYFEAFIRKCTAFITIHGGGNYLYLDPVVEYMALGDEASRISREMAEIFGFRNLWRNEECNPVNGMQDEVAAAEGIPMILPEIGGQSVRLGKRQEDATRLADGIINVMRYLKMLDEPVVRYDDLMHMKVTYLYIKHGGLHTPMKMGGEKVKKGETLAVVTDIFGNEVDRLLAPFDCVIEGFWASSAALPHSWTYMVGEVMDV